MSAHSALKEIPVAYVAEQVSRPSSFSPSPMKPAWVVDRWLAGKYPIRVVEPAPLERSVIALAHDPAYVDAVLDLVLPNGFGTKDPGVAHSLPYTSGSMWQAAMEAMGNGKVAISPSSGFHHACYASGGGFCTFNGLMIATQLLLQHWGIRKVGVLDCDQHFGDGTNEIIRTLRLETRVRHVTAGHGYSRHATNFLKALPEIVLGFADCQILLYQAGADPHEDDPLGGWLSTDQLYERDAIVFSMANQMALPVAWNLAGGYQQPVEKVLAIHDNTLRACLSEYLGREVAALPEPGLPHTALDLTNLEKCHV
jgi:acetoin utilization deacetylase AcuC-like enzyme